MNKPSERIVVFVTPAQKRAISATADELGISVSELMRRAVIAFSATSDQVKAASIVDRLNAPRAPDALAQVLRKAAKPLRVGRGAGLRHAGTEAEQSQAADETGNVTSTDASPAEPAPNHAEHELAQAVARLSADAHAAESDAESESEKHDALAAASEHFRDGAPLPPLNGSPFTRSQRVADEDDAQGSDSAPEGGKFA